MRLYAMQQNERNTALYEAILRLNTLEECIRFFDDLCAVTELRTMEQRYAVAGCLLWTPTHYDTLYGLQGRYCLPVLPLLLLTCLPRRLAAVPDEDTAQTRLVAALALVQAGMVVNIMLAIIAR